MNPKEDFPRNRRSRMAGGIGGPGKFFRRSGPSGWGAVAILTALLIHSAGCPGAAAAEGRVLARIVVEAGPYDRFDTPVSLDLSGVPYNEDEGGLVLRERAGKTASEIRCQLEPGVRPCLWWILNGVTKAGKARFFELAAVDTLPTPASVTSALENGGLNVRSGGRDVLRYNHEAAPLPAGTDPLFTRSGFIHPLWSPSGFCLTRIQPPDHIHHYGIWNPWTKTRFQGREVDFWNLGDGKGTVRFSGYLSRTDGPVFGGFKALQKHMDLSVKGEERTALDEVWDVRAWSPAIPGGEIFLVDFTATLSCAGADSLVLEAYRYGGGIGFRAAGEWTRENARLFTSEGKTRKDADGSQARWCDMSGPTAGNEGRAGVLFMSHPSNRSHPEPMRVWPEDANAGRGDLFFEFCPIRHRSWNLVPGREYVLRYRMLVHEGEIPSGDCERAWRDFAFPPKVTMQ